MRNNQITKQINRTIEDIWMILEKKERSYTNFKLNNQQHVLLTLVIRHPFSSPSELAERMEITKSAVSQQLAKLEKEGYIKKKRHVKDRRIYSITLARKGMLYQKEMAAFNEQIAEKYEQNLSPDELANVLTALQKIQQLLDEK